MTARHTDPPRGPTDARSDVLSDATDLDALLQALLGDQVARDAADGRPADDITPAALAPDAPLAVAANSVTTEEAEVALSEQSDVAPTVAADAVPTIAPGARPQSAVIEPPWSEHAFARRATADDARAATADHTGGAPADDNDGWGFVSEESQEAKEIARDASPVGPAAPVAVAPPLSQRTWRDKLRVSLSKQWLLVAALSAAALITASAIGLRDELAATETQTAPSSETPALVQASSAIQGTSAVRATDSSEVEVWAAAREPEAQPRVVRRTPPRRVNEAPTARTTPSPKPAFVAAPPRAPAPPPVVASPAVVERTTEATNRDAAPSGTAPTENVPRAVTDAASTEAASGATAVNRAEPPPTVTAPLPVSVPRRSAPKLLTGGAPEYPTVLRTARVGGIVEVRFTIDASGRVVNVQSVAGPAQLRAAAEAAVKRWRYEAARVDNVAVETQTSVRFNFDPSTERRPQE